MSKNNIKGNTKPISVMPPKGSPPGGMKPIPKTN